MADQARKREVTCAIYDLILAEMLWLALSRQCLPLTEWLTQAESSEVVTCLI